MLYLAFQFTNLDNSIAESLKLIKDVGQNTGRYKLATDYFHLEIWIRFVSIKGLPPVLQDLIAVAEIRTISTLKTILMFTHVVIGMMLYINIVLIHCCIFSLVNFMQSLNLFL